MKLLALCSEFSPFVGGIGTYAAELSRAAQALGIEVTLAVPDYGQDHGASDRRDFPFDIIRYRGGPHHAKMLPAKFMLTRSLLAHDNFDIVHAMDWPFFLPVALCAGRTPSLYSIFGSEIAGMARPLKRAAIAAAGVFAGGGRVLAISGFTRDLFHEHFPNVPRDISKVTPLGVGADWLAVRPAPERNALGLPEDKLIVLTLARVTRRKGHLTALAALNSLPESLRRRVYYAIAGPDGEPDYRDELERAIALSGVQVGRFTGLDRQAVLALCAASDIFCLPGGVSDGKVEGFGLVLLEAGAQGLPLVAGDTGGVGEVMAGGQSGLLVPVGNAATLADALAQLINDAGLRQRLGQAARTRAETFSWEQCARASYGVVETAKAE